MLGRLGGRLMGMDVAAVLSDVDGAAVGDAAGGDFELALAGRSEELDAECLGALPRAADTDPLSVPEADGAPECPPTEGAPESAVDGGANAGRG